MVLQAIALQHLIPLIYRLPGTAPSGPACGSRPMCSGIRSSRKMAGSHLLLDYMLVGNQLIRLRKGDTIIMDGIIPLSPV
jgi:hypothetical protein